MAIDIAAMKLDADELDEHLFSIGVTRKDLGLIGADCMLDDSVIRKDDFDTDNDFGADNG